MAEDSLYVVVEIPKGSSNKYEWDDELGAIKLDRNAVVVEMIPLQSVASLLPELDGKSFSTGHPIATGTYRLRVIQKDSGKAEEFVMEVPPNS